MRLAAIGLDTGLVVGQACGGLRFYCPRLKKRARAGHAKSYLQGDFFCVSHVTVIRPLDFHGIAFFYTV